MLVVMGALGVFSAVKMGFGARKTAELYIKKADWDWKHGPPRWEKTDFQDEAAHGKEYVSRDEFEMYDVLKNMSFCFFFVALNALIMGKCGFRLIKNQKAGLAQRMLKKGIFFAVLLTLVMFLSTNGKHMREIIERNKTQKHKHGQHNMTRKLQEDEELVMEDLWEPKYGGKRGLRQSDRKPSAKLTEEDLAQPNKVHHAHHKYNKKWDGRKEAYRMFAPKLWDRAQNETTENIEQGEILDESARGKHGWRHHKKEWKNKGCKKE